MVSDNDGSAFITKAEFDSLKNNFQAQIDNYNSSIDSKIDGAIAGYLSGIKMSSEEELKTIYRSDEDGLFFAGDDWLPNLPSINCTITKVLARWQQPQTSIARSGTIITEYTAHVDSNSNNLFLEWDTASGVGTLKFAGDAILSGSRFESFYGTGTMTVSSPDVCIISPYNWFSKEGDPGFWDDGNVFITAPRPDLWDNYFNGTIGSGSGISNASITFWKFTKNDGSTGNWGNTKIQRDCWGKRGIELMNISGDRSTATYGGSTFVQIPHINSRLSYQKNKFKPTALWYGEMSDSNLQPVYDWNLKETLLGYQSDPISQKITFGEGNNITASDTFIFDNRVDSTGVSPYDDWVYTTIGQSVMNCQPAYTQGSDNYSCYGGNFGPLPALTTKNRFNNVTYDGSWVDSSLSSAVSALKITSCIPLFYTDYDSEYTIPLTFTDTSNHWVWLSGSPIPASFNHTNNFTNNLVFSTPIQSNGATLIGETGVIRVRIPANTIVYIKAAKAVTTNDCSCEIKGPIVAKYSKPN